MQRSTGAAVYSVGEWLGPTCNYRADSYSYLSSDDRWISSGEETAGFHALLRNGALLPQQPYTSFKVESFSTSGDCTIGEDGHVVFKTCGRPPNMVGLHPLLMPTDLYTFFQTDLEDSLLTEAASRASQAFDALTMAAEAYESSRLLHGIFRQLSDLRKDPKAVVEVAGNLYLAYRYGYKPLELGFKAIERAVTKLSKHNMDLLHGNAKVAYFDSLTDDRSFAYSAVQGVSRRVVHANVSVIAHAAFLVQHLQSRMSMNPFMTAWELVPYSFVVDWFLDIGNTIQALSLATVAKASNYGIGYRVAWTDQITSLELVGRAGTTYSASGNWNQISSGYLLYRKPATPTLQPHLNVSFTPSRLLDALALGNSIRSSFKSKQSMWSRL